MPLFEQGDVTLHYEEYGSGYPLLLIAPGGMRSTIGFWERMPFNPIKEFAGEFRVIAMDQRNAGESRAPIAATDGWQSYTADQLALLDQLGIDRCHIMGGCIGSSYCLALVQAAPERISAAVLQNPIGLSANNRDAFAGMFDEWANELAQQRADVSRADLHSFGENMFGGDFVFTVSRDFVRSCHTPFLVLAGDDNFHPTATAEEIASLAPNAELILQWKTPEVVRGVVETIRDFLNANTPVSAGT
jgi:pimeloyl-ACP methyl ester carboxylesterase